MHTTSIRIGIVSALQEEQAGLIDMLDNPQTVQRGMRDYTSGSVSGIDCVCVLSRIGKVAAAATTATLIEKFGVTHILFTGVAGGAHPDVRVGDIVIADQLVQHDMDASPLFPRFEVPLTGLSHFFSDKPLSDRLMQASRQFINCDYVSMIGEEDRTLFAMDRPQIHRGLIASGDEFIARGDQLARITGNFPEVLAVEMEGAAVAQVCFEFGIPFAIVRTVSDGANENAPIDFIQFLEKIAARYAFGIVMQFLVSMQGDKVENTQRDIQPGT